MSRSLHVKDNLQQFLIIKIAAHCEYTKVFNPIHHPSIGTIQDHCLTNKTYSYQGYS